MVEGKAGGGAAVEGTAVGGAAVVEGTMAASTLQTPAASLSYPEDGWGGGLDGGWGGGLEGGWEAAVSVSTHLVEGMRRWSSGGVLWSWVI